MATDPGTAAAPFAAPAKGLSAAAKTVRDKINLKASDGCSHIYGFNYQPSWGSNGVTVWGDKFDPKKYREELASGKKYFPKMNAVRIWLSWSAYRADPARLVRQFQQAVEICGELDLLVVPVMFNRWVGNPVWDVVADPEMAADFDATFVPYIRDLVGPLKGDSRILAWDLCNEPPLRGGELPWLGNIHKAVKKIDPDAWTCIGTVTVEQTKACAPYQDILTPHLYFGGYPDFGEYPGYEYAKNVQLANGFGYDVRDTSFARRATATGERTDGYRRERIPHPIHRPLFTFDYDQGSLFTVHCLHSPSRHVRPAGGGSGRADDERDGHRGRNGRPERQSDRKQNNLGRLDFVGKPTNISADGGKIDRRGSE